MEEKRIAKNGIPVYSLTNENNHSFFISMFLKAGCIYESEKENGITHFLEHVTVRNVNRLMGGSLYQILDSHGLEFNASTFSEMVQFYVSSAKTNIKIGIDIIASVLSPLVISPSEVDAERKRIKAEIREADEKNSLSSFSSSVVFFGTSLQGSIIGTNKSVDRITKSRLEAYRKSIFTKENCFFYITGNFTDEDIEYLSLAIDKYELSSGKMRENIAPVPKDFMKRGGKVYIKNADYTSIRFNFDVDMSRLSVPVTDLIYDRLFSGYNSEFFIEMSEERGLIYDVSGSSERYLNIGTLNFSFELKERDLYKACEITISILRDFKEKLLSESECMRAPYVDNAPLLYDDPRELNFTMAYDNKIMNRSYSSLDARIEAYRSITPEEIRQAANIIFTKDNLTVTVKGNKRKIDAEALEKIIAKL
jgi:predicted Zn-dependent peptidase